MTLEQIKEILSDGAIGYFATMNGDQLEVRGWQFQFTEDNKFYFATANTKDVFKQMKANPQVAFACASLNHNVRISGKATFISDQAQKAKAFAKFSPGVQELYKEASNPIVEVFYIGSGEVKVNKGYEPFEVVKF